MGGREEEVLVVEVEEVKGRVSRESSGNLEDTDPRWNSPVDPYLWIWFPSCHPHLLFYLSVVLVHP